ncbi:putative pantothenate transporter [Rhodotorula sp. JG-1b]|nr:putative pantothenate transporter [Rhodotorula sp. JG-1b]
MRSLSNVRANIGNARIAGLEKSLNLKGYDYNILLTSFYVAYVAAELPCQMFTKWLGPGKTIPAFTLMFGLFTFVMAYVKNFGAAIAVRFMLGIAEGAIFPGLAFLLSRYYKKDELGFRLACYIVCAPGAGAVGGLLASGILKIDSIGSISGWRAIFWVEGIISMGIGLISWFLVQDRPSACKWLTPEERELAEFRLVAENVGQSEAVDKMHSKAVWSGIFNVTTIVVSLIFLFDNCVVQGVGFFLPTIIKSIYPGETVIQQQLRTVPTYVVGMATTLATGYLAWKTRRRGLYMLISAPFMVLGFILYLISLDPHVRYAAAFMVAIGAFSFGALCTAWSAANVTSDTARSSAIGTTVFFGNCGGLISTWTFLPKDGPRYVPGNAFNLAGSILMFVLAGGLWIWQRRENKAKAAGRDDHYLEGRTQAEIADLEQKHPEFVYTH